MMNTLYGCNRGKAWENDADLAEWKNSRLAVDIHYHENAAWQGGLLWVDENKQCSFRSALKLLKRMDGALDEKKRRASGMKKRTQWRRRLAGFLVATVLAGDFSNAAASIAYASEYSYVRDAELEQNAVLVTVSQEEIEDVLHRGRTNQPKLKKDKIPYAGAAREAVYEMLQKNLEGRVLIDQEVLESEFGNCMYLVTAVKNPAGTSVTDQVQILVVNPDKEYTYRFKLQILGDQMNIYEAKVTQYEVDDSQLIEDESMETSEDSAADSSTDASQETETETPDNGETNDETQAEDSAAGDAVTEESQPADDTAAEEEDGNDAVTDETETEEAETEEAGSEEAGTEETETKEIGMDEAGTDGAADDTALSLSAHHAAWVTATDSNSDVIADDIELINDLDGAEYSNIEETDLSAEGTVSIRLKSEEELDEDEMISLRGNGERETLETADFASYSNSAARRSRKRHLPSAYNLDVEAGSIAVLEVKNAEYGNVIDFADSLYATDSDARRPITTVSISSETRGEIEAGKIFNFIVAYRRESIPTFSVGGQAPREIYKEINDLAITVKIPKEIRLTGYEPTEVTDTERIYQIEAADLTDNVQKTMMLAAIVEGNGSAPIGTSFSVDPEAAICLTGTIEVEDTINGDSKSYTLTDAGTYAAGEKKEPLEYTITSEDQWAITKEAVMQKSGAEELPYMIEGDQLKFSYKLYVGLKGDDGEVASEAEKYFHIGRAPMDSLTVTDTITFTGKSGKGINPVKMTMKLSGDRDENGSTVTDSNTISLTNRYAELGNAEGTDLSKYVDEHAPYYSVYEVSAWFSKSDFDVYFWEPEFGKDDQFPVVNKASLTYALKGAGKQEKESNPVEAYVQFAKDKGELRIEKVISAPEFGREKANQFDYDRNAVGYNGYAEFKLEKKDANGDYRLYTDAKVVGEDGQYTAAGEEERVWINPFEDAQDEGRSVNAEDGFIRLFVEPGEYRITEVHAPEHTKLQGETKVKTAAVVESNVADVTFVNETEGVGGIQFVKKGRTESGYIGNLQGVEFEIWEGNRTDGDPLATAKSDKDGVVTFMPLKQGTYTIKEKTPLDGYVPDKNSYSVTVEPDKIATIKGGEDGKPGTIINQKNLGTLTFTKWVESWNEKGDSAWKKLTDSQEAYKSAFEVVGYDEAGNEVVRLASVSLRNDGTASVSVKIFDETFWKPITYNIIETIPNGYTAQTIPETDETFENKQTFDRGTNTLTTEETTLKKEVRPDKTIIYTSSLNVYNTPLGSVELTKYQTVPGGTTAPQGNVKFQLVREVSENVLESVEETGAGQTTDANGKITQSNLPVVDEDGKWIDYYWIEKTESEDTRLYTYADAGKTKRVSETGNFTIDGVAVDTTVSGPFHALPTGETAAISGSYTAYAYNVMQQYPIWVKKIDGLTKNTLNGAEFKIYDVTGKEDESQYFADEPYKVVNGNHSEAVMLKIGRTYAIRETQTPEGYYNYGYDKDGKNYQIVDLSSVKEILPEYTLDKTVEFEAAAGDVKGNQVTFANNPKPKLKITKTKKDLDRTEVESAPDTIFDVYTEKEYGIVGDLVKAGLKADGKDTVTLPKAGTYYLKEDFGSAGDVLTPDQCETYKEDSNWFRCMSDGEWYYRVEISDPKTTNDTVTDFLIVNYKNVGRVEVVKCHAWDKNNDKKLLSGAAFTLSAIYLVNGVMTPFEKTFTTGESGKAVFENLKIYDESGKLIEYTVTETQAPEGFFGIKKEETFTLLESEENTQNQNAVVELEFRNEPKLTLTTGKVGIDVWESQFHEIYNEMPDVALALFEEAESGAIVPVLDGNGTPVVELTSKDLARVTFENLSERKSYYVIEVYEPSGDYTIPDGKKPLLPGPPGSLDETKAALERTYAGGILMGDIEQYFCKKVLMSDLVTEEEKGKYNYHYTTENMVNEIPWVQFEIEKQIGDAIRTPEAGEPAEGQKTVVINGTTYVIVDNETDKGNLLDKAQFELYIMDPSELKGATKLTAEMLEGRTPNAHYVSGSLIDPETGERIKGKLRTEIFHDATKIYWLKENKAPTGYAIDPEKGTVAFVPESLNDITGENVLIQPYKGSGITKATIPNYKVLGSGDGADYLAGVKLNKWLAEEKEGVTAYKPLGGVKFQLRVQGYDYVIPQTLTTGLENDPETQELTASAMVFVDLVQSKAEFKEWLIDERGISDAEANKIAEDVFKLDTTNPDEKTMTVTCMLEEIEAPQKVEMEKTEYEIRLKAVGNNMDKSIDNTYYAELKPDSNSEFEEDGHTAIINRVRKQYPVKIYKYGYIPTDDVLGKDGVSDEDLREMLDSGSLPGAEPLGGITFVLEKFEYSTGEYEPYNLMEADAPKTDTEIDPTKGEFTNKDQAYVFESGLPLGKYRISEKDLGKHADDYFNMYPGDEEAYRYFEVTGDGTKEVYLFNPTYPSLTIQKTVLDSVPDSADPVDLNGIKFKLSSGSESVKEAATNAAGIATFEKIEPGTYTIAESVVNNDELTSQYFGAYNEEQVTVGYQRVPADDTDEPTYRLEKLAESEIWTLNDGATEIQIKVQNPKLGGFTLTKVDAEDPEAKLQGATFSFSFAPFSEDDFTRDDGGKKQLKSLEVLETMDVSKRTYGSARTKTTNADGELVVNNLIPGWYKIEETQAPTGYTKSPDIRYIPVTGDMATVGGNYKHVTNYKIDESFTNRANVTVHLRKVLDYGSLQLDQIPEEKSMNGNELSQADLIPNTVTFNMSGVDSAKVGTSTFASNAFRDSDGNMKAAADYQTLKENSGNQDKQLPQLDGNKYYSLEETVAPSDRWTVESAKAAVSETEPTEVELQPLTLSADGKIVINAAGVFHSKTDVYVSVTNKLRAAQIQVKKVNAMGKEQSLKGAHFAVYDKYDKTEHKPVPGTEPLATGITGEDGTCTMTFWLPGNDNSATVYVVETESPANYVLGDQVTQVTVEAGSYVSPKDNPGLVFENKPGVDLELTKYDNVYAESKTANKVTTDIQFVLYQKERNAANDQWQPAPDGTRTVNASGPIVWKGLDVLAYDYALYENPVTEGTYKNSILESVHQVTNGEAVKEGLQTTELDTGETLYLLDGLEKGATYHFYAYNKPANVVTIRKTSVDSTATTAPTAVFEIKDAKGDVVETVTTSGNITSTDQSGPYSEATVKLKDGTYTITEIETTSDGYVLVKNDSRVVWEQKVKIPDTKNANTYTFANLAPQQSVTVTKKTDNEPLENLWWTEKQEKTFEITPEVTNDSPLNSFVLTDPGLTMLAKDGKDQKDLTDSAYYTDTYDLEELKIPVPTADNSYIKPIDRSDAAPYFEDGTAGVIHAVVTLYTRGGEPIDEIPLDPKDAAGGFWTVTVPEDTISSQDVAGFTIRYTDPDLNEKSDGAYALGRGFEPGTIKATYVLYQQPRKLADGSNANKNAEEVTGIRNDVTAAMTWNTFTETGEAVTKAESKSDADVAVPVNEPDVPVIEVSKNITEGKTNIAVGSKLTYELKLKNVSDSEKTAAMDDPIFLDRLPDGMELSNLNEQWYDVELTPGADITLNPRDVFTVTHDGTRYLYIPFKGHLKQGEEIKITYEVTASAGVIRNTDGLTNRLYVTSGNKKEEFVNNLGGAAFKVLNESKEPQWPNLIPESDPGVRDMIEENIHAIDGFGFAYAHIGATYSGRSQVELLKEVKGNLDDDYVASGVSAKATPDEAGTVTYRLTVMNSSLDQIGNLNVLDILPKPGDTEFGDSLSRNSKWGVHVMDLSQDGNLHVETQAEDKTTKDITKDVTVKYTTLDDFSQRAHKEQFELNGYVGEASDWSTGYTKDATAVIFQLDGMELNPGHSVVIEFKTQVDVDPSDPEDVESKVLTYSVNDFALRYELNGKSYRLPSNKVTAILIPGTVNLGGKIWIDANNNGIQEEEELNDPVFQKEVQRLWNEKALAISLIQMGQETGTIEANELKEGTNRFEFKDLIPARPVEGQESRLYEKAGDPFAYSLNTLYLRGDTPQHYELYMTLGDDSGSGIIWEAAKAAQLQTGDNPDSGKSRKPDSTDLYGPNAAETKDSNFYQDPNNTNGYVSEDFFLWQMEDEKDYDHTKDFGLVPYRSISVRKTDEGGNPVEGAAFAIYGPFTAAELENLTAESLAVTTPVYTGKTGEDGSLADIPNLLYYQNYVLAEENTAPGYVLDGAAADLEPAEVAGMTAWVIPDMRKADAEGDDVNAVQVTNTHDTGSMQFKKIDGSSLEPLAGARFSLTWSPLEDDGTNDTAEAKEAAWARFREKFLASESNAAGITDRGEDLQAADREWSVWFTTTGDEQIVIEELPYGSYVLNETKAPEGYNPLTGGKQISFAITAAERSFVAEDAIENTRADYTLNWQKKDVFGEPAANIGFRVEGPGRYNSMFLFQWIEMSEDSGFSIFTTNEAGLASASNIPFGDYKITELETDAYRTADTFYVRIHENGDVELLTETDNWLLGGEKEQGKINFTVINDIETGSLSLDKVEERDGKNLSEKLIGAQFELSGDSFAPEAWNHVIEKTLDNTSDQYALDGDAFKVVSGDPEKGTLVFEITEDTGILSGQKTTVLEKIPYGTYTITEVNAPSGFVLDEEPWSAAFTLDAEQKDAAFTGEHAVGNKANELLIEKIDANDNSKKLEGAVFVLSEKENGFVTVKDGVFAGFENEEAEASKLVSGADGRILVTQLPAGTYSLKEIQAPADYRINGNIPEFTVEENEEIPMITVTNDRSHGQARIKKVAYRNADRLLSGAVFGFYTDEACTEANKVTEVTTGADGMAITGMLPVGTYYIKELKAPAGYRLENTVYTVTIGSDGMIYDVTSLVDGEVVPYITNRTTGGGGGNSGGGGGNDGGGGGGTTTIPEQPVPMAQIPGEQVPLATIDPEEVPLVALPKTGDEIPKALYAMLLSVAAALGLVIARKKRKEDES